MPLLRLSDCASLSGWDYPNTPEQIARKWFDDFKDPSPSLYESNSSIEEVEVVAAVHLTNPTAKRKAYHVLRIDNEDLVAADIRPNNNNPGSTGVVAVDFRHWEIPANQGQLVRLVERILERIVACEERLRWIGVRLQEGWWKHFLDAPADQVVPEARRRSHCLLKQHPFRPTDPDQLVKEFWANPPRIPDRGISPHAQREYEERLQQGREGTAEDDWTIAVKKVRDLYFQQIAGFAPPPLGVQP